jgi:uncharacterized protein
MPASQVAERRFTTPLSATKIEMRADGKRSLSGYAAVFYRADEPGTQYEIWDDFHERIMPGAFDRAIQEGDDVRALVNHNPDNILGRTKSATCRLSVDNRGLKYEVDLPDTQLGKDIAESVSRGDISGCSFSFIAERVVWVEEESRTIRQVEGVRLLDVGPVTYPAYEATEVMARSAQPIVAEHRKLAQEARLLREADTVLVRSRLIAVDESN